MTSKRLLDAAALLGVSCSLISKHLALRSRQLDLYSRTSSVSNALAGHVVKKPFDLQKAPTASKYGNEVTGSEPSDETVARPNERLVSSIGDVNGGVGQPLSKGSDTICHTENTAFNAARDAQLASDINTKQGQSTTNLPNNSQFTQAHKPHESESDTSTDGFSEELMQGLFRSRHVANILKEGGKHGHSKPANPYAQTSRADQARKWRLESFPHAEVKKSTRDVSEPALQRERAAKEVRDQESVTEVTNDHQREQSTNTSSVRAEAATAPYRMRESRVPSSRFGRLWQYGGLATSMAFGAVGEGFRRAAGGGSQGSVMLSSTNIERLVAKLSRMRGAALKLGQMISFQDSKMLPPAIIEVLQRVQDSADYMPVSQRDKVLSKNLGSTWRSLFESFEEMPIAAASIGQVHKAILKSTGLPVAVKVQYPGVADSIDSDLNNLSILLTASRLLPKGLYLDKTIANARVELAWECDYIREAQCLKRFQHLLKDETSTFVVPDVIDEASGKEVLTMELMNGIGVTKLHHCTQAQKDWIGTQILRLCLREISEFKFMQTDPNWTNFLYNSDTCKLELLDFGASRDYPEDFIRLYTRILLAASRGDRKTCRDLSIELGYLTGLESHAMVDAHVTSILTLAEPFTDSAPAVYDFRDQTITDRVRELIPTMLRERLAPPPEETYSLHRKLSGAFLLCARLGSRVRCRDLFANAMVKVGLV